MVRNMSSKWDNNKVTKAIIANTRT